MRTPRWNEPGLRRVDAPEVVVVACSHPAWATVNAKLGCIASDHGPWPPAEVDPYSGMRLVDGLPTRFDAVKP